MDSELAAQQLNILNSQEEVQLEAKPEHLKRSDSGLSNDSAQIIEESKLPDMREDNAIETIDEVSDDVKMDDSESKGLNTFNDDSLSEDSEMEDLSSSKVDTRKRERVRHIVQSLLDMDTFWEHSDLKSVVEEIVENDSPDSLKQLLDEFYKAVIIKNKANSLNPAKVSVLLTL